MTIETPPVPDEVERAAHWCDSGCPAECRSDNIERLWPVAYGATLRIVAAELQRHATMRLVEYGKDDARGAALWDAARHVAENMGADA